MTRFQIGAVAICMVLNLIDGFDVLAVAFAAPMLAKDWQLAPDRLGLLFSAGLFGMTAGSLLLAPFADRFGRLWNARSEVFPPTSRAARAMDRASFPRVTEARRARA
jgi:MFS family permease